MPLLEKNPLDVFLSQARSRTFVDKVRRSDGFASHVIRTYDANDRPCWFLLKASEVSLLKLEHTAYEDFIDLTQYGEVLASGWGHETDHSDFTLEELEEA